MSEALAIAVDGGNSKTDLALVRGDGEVLSLVRGPLSSPHHLGLDGALEVLDRLLDQAARQAMLPPAARWPRSARSTWPALTSRRRSAGSRRP